MNVDAIVTCSKVAIAQNSDDAAEHKTHEPHCERPERTVSLWKRVMESDYAQHCDVHLSHEADIAAVERCHGGAHLRWLNTIAASVDASDEHMRALRSILRYPDMYVTRATSRAAMTACGTTIGLLDQVLAKHYRRAFAFVRPPGHHAGCHGPAGFCFINNAMCAAVRAVDHDERVAIVDIDVHFGDGTVDLMHHHASDDERLAYFSLHRYDDGNFYPNDKRASGSVKTPLGRRLVAVPFDGPIDNDRYWHLFTKNVLPRLREYAPTLIIVSAGYDACVNDPLGECLLTPAFYGTLFDALLDICPRILAILEGGYNLDATNDAALASLAALVRHA